MIKMKKPRARARAPQPNALFKYGKPGPLGLRLGEDIGMVGLENQNEYNCMDFLVTGAYLLGKSRK